MILDDLRARRLAQAEGFPVRGSAGVLEASFRKGYLSDLREAYGRLLRERTYIDTATLNASLRALDLPPL